MNKIIRNIGAAVLVCLWAALTVVAWFGEAHTFSLAERRQLAQFPELTTKTLLNGKFMSEFESYTLDQFPLRDTFRQIKALFHYNALQQKDNNNIYIVDSYAAEMEYPLNTDSLDRALGVYNHIYENLLKDTNVKIYNTIVPDKGYYLAEANGYLSMDYEQMFATMRSKTPWAAWVGIEDCLTLQDYYYTDTHWRQEKLLPVAQRLLTMMGAKNMPQTEDFTVEAMARPFYGVYYGQAALPMNPETMYLMENEAIRDATVYNYVTGKTVLVYDPATMENKDQYDIYLGGMQSLLTITNPNATTDRELVIFRDSFGSSLAPLMLQSYKTVTLVDVRYISPMAIGKYVEFNNQDVLFMYSALVLNKNLIR